VGVAVLVGDGGTVVKDGVSVTLGVNDGVMEEVGEEVKVNDGVNVAGWNGVEVTVDVAVLVGVNVWVGVLLAVPVRISGVGLKEAVSVTVGVNVGVGVKLPGVGARAMATKPIQ